MTLYSEASYSKQILAGLLDACLILMLVLIIDRFLKPEIMYQWLANINSSLFVLIVFAFYRLISLLFFSQTLGMKIFQLTLLNGEEKPIRGFEKLLAAFFILYRGTSYYHIK